MISFITTARNETSEVLDRTIDGLLRTTPANSREVIVIDDGSEVPVHISHSEIILHRNPIAVGVSQARRTGSMLASGSILVFLDAHMTFATGWLDRMLAHVDSGALLCSEFWDYDLSHCHCWGADFRWSNGRDYAAQRYPGFGINHRTGRPSCESAIDIPMIIGACYMMQRDSYWKLGGFCPLFRTWGVDEQDMSARAWISGCGVKCVVDARVGHLSRTTFPYPVSFEHLEFNQLLMIRSLFEEHIVRRLERRFAPIPRQVRSWLRSVDLTPWRATVQTHRQLSDGEFFRRFVPSLAAETNRRSLFSIWRA